MSSAISSYMNFAFEYFKLIDQNNQQKSIN